ncbi:MAG TPA: molybdopterin cofactor-binding domain-containing protein [Candidatus Lustribacter sp.]|jgi:isoquinoline 1-oxidoreductase beta subunit|nr:molybdopterin cofactor-binding domain-containing protein [Candidatus Lustribacter sp.]
MTRRSDFIRLTAALGAGLGFELALPAGAQTAAPFAPNAFVRIAPDETVTVVVNMSEMGQGVATGLPTILADELDAALDRIRYTFAPAEPAYNNPIFGEQATGGSTAVQGMWMPLRQAGATARAMLVAAAAKQWGVAPAECTTRAGVVYHAPSSRSATYGSLSAAAAAMPVPANVALKTPAQFTLIGKVHPRPDIPLKVNGKAQYGIDVRLPGMRYAAIARSPVFGGRVVRFDASKAKAIPGVTGVVQISNGVAVIGKNTWAAFQGKLALAIVWDKGPNAKVSSASLFSDAEHLAKTGTGARIAISRGKPAAARGTVVEATYRAPFLAHATMEPMNTTADVRAEGCEVWTPCQVQTRALAAAVRVTGLQPAQCTIHTTFLGGGFGRRLEMDYVQEAVEVSKAIKAPVKVTWTREDDIQADFYRPLSVNVVRGVLAHGQLTALTHRVVQKSWLHRWAPAFEKNGVDSFALTEATDAPYAVPNFEVSYIDHEHGIPIGSWRAPNANWNGFVTESFIDELAHAAHEDPLAFRLALLTKNPRAANVLRLAAARAGWGRKHAGVAQGLAVTFWNGSYVASVADVSLSQGQPKVHRVVTALDCGQVVNPDIVVQQAQGATNFGLSAALTGKITIQNGSVQQNNFYDYTVLRMADAPAIEVHVVQSNATPTGVGEICTPPIAPAVGNALFVLTGRRIRSLPFSDFFT